ncbi:MAG TPA: hypothetical protein VE913_05260 [Longimicrobium sp.]|nr:hypothetical protein [Longimicrobium sp.]
MQRFRRGDLSLIVLALIFVVAGILHFAFPAPYVRIMPPWLPFHRELVLVSGAFQIAGGLGLLVPRARRAAGVGLILLLLAVWPANWQMVVAAREAGASAAAMAVLWARLPLQVALIWWVWRAAVHSPRRFGGSEPAAVAR